MLNSLKYTQKTSTQDSLSSGPKLIVYKHLYIFICISILVNIQSFHVTDFYNIRFKALLDNFAPYSFPILIISDTHSLQ